MSRGQTVVRRSSTPGASSAFPVAALSTTTCAEGGGRVHASLSFAPPQLARLAGPSRAAARFHAQLPDSSPPAGAAGRDPCVPGNSSTQKHHICLGLLAAGDCGPAAAGAATTGCTAPCSHLGLQPPNVQTMSMEVGRCGAMEPRREGAAAAAAVAYLVELAAGGDLQSAGGGLPAQRQGLGDEAPQHALHRARPDAPPRILVAELHACSHQRCERYKRPCVPGRW